MEGECSSPGRVIPRNNRSTNSYELYGGRTRGNNLPNLLKSDCGSSCRWGTPPTGESIPHSDDAALTRLETSLIGGRSVRWVCQQSSNNFQTLSERPTSNAFAGFEGLPPPTTLNTTSDPDNFPNGSVPVSTWTGRIRMRVLGVARHPPGRPPLLLRICRPPWKACTCPIRT